jgi:4-amino-4-deoxy-L-arabinose transferase-like glycosyltransferase
LTQLQKRWLYALWLLFIAAFALLHALHLSADFPNHTPWFCDWAKYTDEGWYGNAGIRAHLFPSWYIPGDFTPAPVAPVLPFLEWLLFFFTGVSVEAARGLAVGFFFLNLLLSYLLLRTRGPRWMALLGLTLMVTSPFLYCFSRLAILEPVQIAFTLAALNLAVRLPRMRRPVAVSVAIGLLFTLMLLTKTTAVFLLPALGWAMILPLWKSRKLAIRCALAAACTFAAAFGLWMALVVRFGLMGDFNYFFFLIHEYPAPKGLYSRVVSFWWAFHGGLWVDHLLIPLAGLTLVGVLLASAVPVWRRLRARLKDQSFADQYPWARKLLLDPVFGASVLAIAGNILFIAVHNNNQPRYLAVTAFFCFISVALGSAAMLGENSVWARRIGSAYLAVLVLAASFNGLQTLNYAAHPEYTYIDAARRLTQYIDAHPNGNRLLLTVSSDQITLFTHLPTLCDELSMQDLAAKAARYQPGWYAAWNELEPGRLADLHQHFSLEQVASFRALDDPDRNLLVLFKLHPLPNGQERSPGDQNLQVPLPDDKIDIDIDVE